MIAGAALLFLAALPSSLSAKSVVYDWSADNYFNTKQSATWTYTWVSGTSGPLRCACNGTNQTVFYDMILPAVGSAAHTALQGGGKYSVEISYYIETPTIEPAYFYIYARNTAGNIYDIWHQFAGDPSTTLKTIIVPLDLKTIGTGNTWNVRMGVKGHGTIIISKYTIYSGTDETTVDPVLNGNPVSNTAGVTAATGSAPVVIAPPTGTGTLSMASYNFVPNSPAAAATNKAQLAQAILDCASQGKHTLTIPTGKYWLASATTIPIANKTDLTIDGQGSTLVYAQQVTDSTGSAMYISGSTRLLIKNLNIDWDWTVLPLASIAKVSNLTATSCDFTFEDLTPTQTEKARTSPWISSAAAPTWCEMDPVTLSRKGNPANFHLALTGVPAASGTNVLHVNFTAFTGTAPIANGKYYIIRHSDYGMAAFKTYSSNNVLFDNVKIYSITGMGWLWGADSHHFGIKNGGIVREAGSRNPFTTARDGVHVMESQGDILIENSAFTGAGDDMINIHDRMYEAVITVTGSNTASFSNYVATNPLRVNIGDTLEFFDSDFSRLNGSATPVTRIVSGISNNNPSSGFCTMTFTAPLPSPLSPNAIVRNNRYNTSNVHIKGCSIYNSGGRILVSGNNVTIENSTFNNCYAAPIELEVNLIQNLWWEGDGVTNMLIRNNDFYNVAQSGEFGGAVIYARPTLPCGPSAVPFFNQVSVLNNNFDRVNGPVLALNNCSNVIASQNQINYTQAPASVTNNYVGTILARRSSLLALGGNTWINHIASPYPPGVIYDTANTTGVNAATNAVVNFSVYTAEDFQGYTNGTTFSTGQTMGAAGSGWAYGWKTSGSYATPRGTVTASPLVDAGQFLACTVTTQAAHTAASGSISRPFTATGITAPFKISFSIRPDSAPANVAYYVGDNRNVSAFGPDSTSAWHIAALNGTWQFFDGPANGGPNSYVDTGIPVTVGNIYDVVITVNPVTHTWKGTMSSPSAFFTRSGLNARATTFDTDTVTAIGGRWLTFAVREIVTGTSVGATGTFSIDSLLIEY